MDTIKNELKQEVLAQAEIIVDLEAQNIAQARTIREQAVIIREHQAADVLAVEAIRILTADLKRITSAIEDIKIYGNNPSAWDYYDDGVSQKICALVNAAKSEQVKDACTCGHSLDSHTKSGIHPCEECECLMFWAEAAK